MPIHPDVAAEHTRAADSAFRAVFFGGADPASLYAPIPSHQAIAARLGVPLYVAAEVEAPDARADLAKALRAVAGAREAYVKARAGIAKANRFDRSEAIATAKLLSAAAGLRFDHRAAHANATRSAAWMRAMAFGHLNRTVRALRRAEVALAALKAAHAPITLAA